MSKKIYVIGRRYRGFKFWLEKHSSRLFKNRKYMCGNGIFNVPKYRGGVMTILKYFVT